MNTELHNPEVYDFRKYDRVWQRVGPQMEPYPASPADAQSGTMQGGSMARDGGMAMAAAPEAQLPGADRDPCCMGTDAAESAEVVAGFIEEELADGRYYRAMSRQSPQWARQRLRELAAEETGHAKRLMAVYYLITGACYTPLPDCGHICVDSWCAALRHRYHEEACGGFNYARAADATPDLCLTKIFRELSADEYRHGELLLTMLERSLRS